MTRIAAMAIAIVFAIATPAAASSGGIGPEPTHSNHDSGGIGSCVVDRHGEFCHTLAFDNESESNMSGLFIADRTDDRGVSPMRGTLRLQKKISGEWVTIDRRSEMSRSNRCHTKKLHIRLPIMQLTKQPHRLVATVDRETVARMRI
jgi:hypothetical protein